MNTIHHNLNGRQADSRKYFASSSTANVLECSGGNVIVRLSELSRHGSDKIITASKQQGKCLSVAKDQIASLNYTVIIRNV